MRAIVLSDLHLGANSAAATDDAFVSFLEWLAERAQLDAVPSRLVVLGDFLDLLRTPSDVRDPLSALDAVAGRHLSVLAALGAAAAHGVVIDLVPGNHDSELIDPVLQERLLARVADAAGTSAARLRPAFRVRPWFLVVPGLLYAEHGSQYHALNAVADPLAPCGRWSPRLPLGAVLDRFLCGAEGGARAHSLPRLLPAALRALAIRGREDAATAASLHAYAGEAGLSTDGLVALRRLADDSSAALLRNVCAVLLRRAGHVESRQQRATVAIHQILASEGQPVPVYVFGHTHRVAHRTLHADDGPLLWFNAGAWEDGSHGFVELDGGVDGVVVRLCQWDPVSRSTLTVCGPLLAQSRVRQERAPATRGRSAGNRSADPVVTS